jgi:DNA (cytosine-5)-methyltransferase 1
MVKDEVGNYSKKAIREILKNLRPGQYIRLRKLTPTEVFRFMGVPVEYIVKLVNQSGNSDAQLYKQAGNSIVVDVLYHLFKNIFDSYYNQIVNNNS